MINRKTLSLLAPPFAVMKHGCASCTAAPIAVFWLASLVSIGYGLVGGVLGSPGRSWTEIFLGIILWVIAAAWARLVIGGVTEDTQAKQNSPLQRRVVPGTDEPEPFEEARKAH
ncbi:MAG: hypothetical protein H6970_02430 [Gammaproteobacteria bacterium]|nr:hypothetical protein [Gammaproteobacteria bacterium]MCP5423914.1 hypothetical protein [Gammaproteobacteria bacterium]MCP5459393.1 hypothetical protein [Gammaproteobacteria bacterium]